MATQYPEVVSISSDSESDSEQIILISDSDVEISEAVPRKERESSHAQSSQSHASAWESSTEQKFEAELQLTLEVSLQEYQAKNALASTSGEHGTKQGDQAHDKQNIQRGHGDRLNAQKDKTKLQQSWSQYKAEKERRNTQKLAGADRVSRDMYKLKMKNTTVTSGMSDLLDSSGHPVSRKKFKLESDEEISGLLVFKSMRSSQRIFDENVPVLCTPGDLEDRSPSPVKCSSSSSGDVNAQLRPHKKLNFVKVESSSSEDDMNSLPDLDGVTDVEIHMDVMPPQRPLTTVLEYNSISDEEQTRRENAFHTYSDILDDDDDKKAADLLIYGDISSDDDNLSEPSPSPGNDQRSSESSLQERHFLDIFSPAKRIKLEPSSDVPSAADLRESLSSFIPVKGPVTSTNVPVSKSCSVICTKLTTCLDSSLVVSRKVDEYPTCSVSTVEYSPLVASTATSGRPKAIQVNKDLSVSGCNTPIKISPGRSAEPMHRSAFRMNRSSMVQSDMRKFIQISPKKTTSFHDAAQNRKVLHPTFMSDFALPEKTVVVDLEPLEFSATQGCTVDACMEEGTKFIDHVLDLVKGFSLYNMPSDSVVQYIFNTGLIKSETLSQSYKAFNILSYIQRKYPHAIKVDFQMVSTLIDNLGLNKVSQMADKCTIVNSTLSFQLIVQVLHGDLQHRDLSDPKSIRNSLAYRVLLGEHAFNQLRNISDCIHCAVNCEYEVVRENHLNLQVDIADKPRGPPAVQELKMSLPYLQQLLEIGILVSNSNVDCAKNLATAFVSILNYSSLEHKKLLLQTVSSDLLRFKLCQLYLEAYCDSPQCCEDFPRSLLDVVECSFQAVPPNSHLTPPLTPSDDDQDIDNMIRVSPQSCEQLVLIQYYVVYSYLKASRGQTYKTLRRRARSADVQFELSHEDTRLLRDEWGNLVESLRLKVLQLAGDVTPLTERYLSMMLCLGMTA